MKNLRGSTKRMMKKHTVRLVKVYDAPNRRDEQGRVWYELLANMHFATSQVGWAVGGRQFLHTVDGGRTWVNQFESRHDCPHFYPRRVFAVSTETSWVLASLSPTNVRCCFTRDGGKTWQGKNFAPEMQPNDLFFIDSKHGWLASNDAELPTSKGQVHITQDEGETWLSSEILTAGVPYKLSFLNILKGWLIEHYLNGHGTQSSRLHTSSDGGNSWREITSFERELLDVHALHEEQVFVVGENGFIARSLDGGKNWKRIDSRSRASLNAIQFYDDRLGVALGDFNTLLLTTDGGDNWERIKFPYDAGNLIGAHFTTSRSGIIASGQGLYSFELDL